MFGFGGSGGVSARQVRWALEQGYKLFDTSQATEFYNERALGEAFEELEVPRSSIWITSKLHPRDHGYQSALAAFPRSLQNLYARGYLDAFLLHFPECFANLCAAPPAGRWEDSWRALEQLFAEHKVKAVGVCNFDLSLLRRLNEKVAKETKPMIVQNYFDPTHHDRAVRSYCASHGIVYQGFSVLGQQWVKKLGYNPILTHSIVTSIAAKHNATPAQVVIQWALDKGVAVLARSLSKSRIAENRQASVHLSAEDIRSIDTLEGMSFQRTQEGSKNAGTYVQVHFVNHRPHVMWLFWHDRLVGEIAPGGELAQATHVGHTFTAQDNHRSPTEKLELSVQFEGQVLEIGRAVQHVEL